MTPDAVLMPRAHILYSDVIDALSRGLITHSEAEAVIRMIFLLSPPPIMAAQND